MPNLKEVRNRIASVNSTKQITSAMKMVSASKLRKTQNTILKLRPYATKIREILQNLSASFDSAEEIAFYEKRPIEKVLVIPISSNRGLCGPFNANAIKATYHHIQHNYQKQLEKNALDLICFGKKSNDFFKKKNIPIIENHTEIIEQINFDDVSTIAENIMQAFLKKKYDRVDVIYNHFKNAGSQIVRIEQFLPVIPADIVEGENSHSADYIFEPDRKTILQELVPKSLKIQFYKILLDSVAAEHGARMTAMHKATENANDLIKDLKLSYNKARQAAITNDIIEIVSGADALKN